MDDDDDDVLRVEELVVDRMDSAVLSSSDSETMADADDEYEAEGEEEDDDTTVYGSSDAETIAGSSDDEALRAEARATLGNESDASTGPACPLEPVMPMDDEFSKWLEATIRCCAQYRSKGLRAYVRALDELPLDKQWSLSKDAIVDHVLPVVEYRFRVAGTRQSLHADIAGSFKRAIPLIPSFAHGPPRLKMMLDEARAVCTLYSTTTTAYIHILSGQVDFDSNVDRLRATRIRITQARRKLHKLSSAPPPAPANSTSSSFETTSMRPLVDAATWEAMTLEALLNCQRALLTLQYKDALLSMHECKASLLQLTSNFRKRPPLARRLERIVCHIIARCHFIFFENFARPLPQPTYQVTYAGKHCYVRTMMHIVRKHRLAFAAAFGVASWVRPGTTFHLNYTLPANGLPEEHVGTMQRRMPMLFSFPFPLAAGFYVPLFPVISTIDPMPRDTPMPHGDFEVRPPKKSRSGSSGNEDKTSHVAYLIARADECIAVVFGVDMRYRRDAKPPNVPELTTVLVDFCTHLTRAFTGQLPDKPDPSKAQTQTPTA
ncbi:hypothetical protein PTSG_00590 [Salpingoeca rosetta]|uniref:Uncharacterized protein n=1 Tax=Salpingoeca rosetta (strain ATCC 50818 / BSB-021) TaxID=946362 RepID=F2TWW9_SALR5|nr:uncharacterized protein PTSG_00590 [Salpingoeca rosetta]EGD72565.1 hypothetical protein PTSG_00590 [Salpingoeca rosetta]|eukprot:XP_004999134.1 hypothetical protein PTSG_00590 [Salpingoeca rosetta]